MPDLHVLVESKEPVANASFALLSAVLSFFFSPGGGCMVKEQHFSPVDYRTNGGGCMVKEQHSSPVACRTNNPGRAAVLTVNTPHTYFSQL